jgi:carbamoyl-phosphate synthase large subunit
MSSERVFVSGAAGVIGRELVPRLLSRGVEVWAADLKPRPPEIPATVRYRQGDLNALAAVEVSGFAPTIFIHLAATFERSVETYAFWDENFAHNVRLSHHLMTLLKDTPTLRRVVFASSYLIYDPGLYLFDEPREHACRLKETDAIRPRNLTGVAKLAHETELRFLADHCKGRFTSVSARIFRGYGRGSRDIVSRWVRSALAGEPLVVYQPEGLFDYVYAGDTAEGLLRLAELPHVTGVVNLGTGEATRVQDVLAAVVAQIPATRVEQTACDLPYEASCADVTLLNDAIGWQPATPIAQGVQAIVEYEKRHESKARPSFGNVLVTSASRKAPFIRAVISAARRISSDISVFAGDADASAPARHVADQFVHLPPTDDRHLADIVEACRVQGISVVIPTRDGELAFWARHVGHLRQHGIKPIVSSLSAIEICRDKVRFARHVADLGLRPVPCIDQRSGEGRYVVKERFGSGSRDIGLNLTAREAGAHAARLREPIFQPYIPGREVSIDAWLNANGSVKGLVLRYRDTIENGESVETTTFRHPAIESSSTTLLESLELRGPVVLQALLDDDGSFWFLELNPRFGGASTAGVAAGLDVWHWSLAEAFGTPASDIPFHRVAGEVRQVRLPSDLHIDGSRL